MFRTSIIAITFILALSSAGCSLAEQGLAPEDKKGEDMYIDNADYQEYLKFFEEVYSTMDQNYYHPVTRENFSKFLYVFNNKIYGQLKQTGKSSNFIKWRSSAHLVDALKSPGDTFSAFFPPKAAKDYEEEVLGKRIDLGLEGELSKKGYEVTRVEPRADAYAKGLRQEDIILKLDDIDVTTISEEQINELLTPLEETIVKIEYFDSGDQFIKVIKVVSKEYFKQFVFMIPVDVPDVYCISIQRFNRKTAEDLTQFMTQILKKGGTKLIIDLRDNPGGPPLAAREISAFFLPPNEEFAYFQKKNHPKAVLHVPEIPAPYQYKGDIVMLVNEKSGSAAELFAGVLQDRAGAIVMGTNTAGRVLLKSMFHFDDDSMVLLVTARGHYSDGRVFSYAGITPDEKIGEDSLDLIKYAAKYLAAREK